MAKQELPLSSHNEREDSLNRGNYFELIQFISKYDNKLHSNLHGTGAFKGPTNEFQNDTIEWVVM